MSIRILNCDVMEGLRQLADESVHCVVTSPPYWGLRDYGTGKWIGGDPHCDHRSPTMRDGRNEDRAKLAGSAATNSAQNILAHNAACGKCGAVKVDHQIGLEPTLGEHLAKMVEVFREVRRVLRPDGTVWLNYGDCYATSANGRSAADTKAAGNDDRTFRDKPFTTTGPIYDPAGGSKGGGARGDNKGGGQGISAGRICAGGYLKSKDLCMVPHRLAIALQEDGWWVRADVVWHKPNPMPESVKDRPTKAHEYVFLLTKSDRYFYDADAIKEATTYPDGPNSPQSIASPYGQGFTRTANLQMRKADGPVVHGNKPGRGDGGRSCNKPGQTHRNKRSVWTMATRPFPEAHFATFPPELPETCIKAGCPKGGTVLDPFGGAGTTAVVADILQRDAILIELNPEYVRITEERLANSRGSIFTHFEPPVVSRPAEPEPAIGSLFDQPISEDAA